MPKICVIPGDGVGPEVIDSTLEVLHNLDLDLTFEKSIVGTQSFEQNGVYITKETLELATTSDAILFGALITPRRRDYVSPLLLMRWNLDLYANVRPAICMNPDFCLVPGIDSDTGTSTQALGSATEHLERDWGRAKVGIR